MYLPVYGRIVVACCVLVADIMGYIDGQSDYYDVVKDSKVISGFSEITLTGRSAMYCAISCLDERWCGSTNYYPPSGDCELTHIWLSASSGHTTPAPGWTTLYRTGLHIYVYIDVQSRIDGLWGMLTRLTFQI
jgi:hypothetical protein